MTAKKKRQLRSSNILKIAFTIHLSLAALSQGCND